MYPKVGSDVTWKVDLGYSPIWVLLLVSLGLGQGTDLIIGSDRRSIYQVECDSLVAGNRSL